MLLLNIDQLVSDRSFVSLRDLLGSLFVLPRAIVHMYNYSIVLYMYLLITVKEVDGQSWDSLCSCFSYSSSVAGSCGGSSF